MLFQGLVGLSEAMYLWLVAAGLSLIFGVMRVLNFAHGSLYMLGAYFAWVVVRVTGSFWLALLIGPAVVAGVGWAMEFGFLRRVYSAPEACPAHSSSAARSSPPTTSSSFASVRWSASGSGSSWRRPASAS